MKVCIEYIPTINEWRLSHYKDGVLMQQTFYTTYGLCLKAAAGF